MSHTLAITPDQFTTFGELLKFLRHRAGLTQRELSIAVDYSESQISRMEQNQRAPDQAAIAARFVPALGLETERAWAARLLELAVRARSEREGQEGEAERPPHNLPIQLTSFVGREREIAEIKRLLAPTSGARVPAKHPASDGGDGRTTSLITLTGPGGIGKTRLALEVAFALLDAARFPDGVWWVDLAPLANPALVVQTVATLLGLQEEASRPLLATLTDYFRGKKALLVLDNCEHLVAASAQFAEALLQGSPNLQILATSRELLGFAGEKPFYVPALSSPDARAAVTVDTAIRYEAVRLFVERATAVLPNFVLTSDNAPAITQVCRRLDGIPLAIELAAARVRMLPVEQIAERLDGRFRLLTGGSRTALPRHQTLQALIDWSYELLTEAEQVLLRRLGVFAGGWTLEAAEAVGVGKRIAADAVFDVLAHLIDKSLVVAEEQCGAARYRMLETIREYALERLVESGEAEAIRRQHADFFLRLAEDAQLRLFSADRRLWSERLEAEHDNFRTALAWSWASDGDAEIGLRLAGALGWFWNQRGYLSEGREWLKRALSSAGDSARNKVRAQALFNAGMLDFSRGQYAASRSELEESMTIWRELRDKQGLAYSLHFFGLAILFQGDLQTAQAELEECVALFREFGDKWGLAIALNDLGLAALAQGNVQIAHRLFEESLTFFRETGDKWGISFPLTSLGRLALQQGDYAPARTYLEQGLALRIELGDQWAIAHSLHALGVVARSQQEYKRAAALFEESLAFFREVGNKQGIALCLAGFAGIAGAASQPERAARLLGTAEALLESIGATLFLADRADYDRNLAAVRAQLDDQKFATGWEEGRVMTLEQAITYALGDI